jgi:hypothetical protein
MAIVTLLWVVDTSVAPVNTLGIPIHQSLYCHREGIQVGIFLHRHDFQILDELIP